MENFPVETHDFRLQCPFSYGLFGASQSGKTSFIIRLIEMRDEVFSKPVGEIHYFFKSWQPAFNTLEREHNVIFHEGVLTMDWLERNVGLAEGGVERTRVPLIIVDDAGEDLSSDSVNLVTVGAHHCQVMLFFLLHQVFGSSPHLRAISQNLSYFQVHKNPRDNSTATHLAKQIDPGQKGGRFMRLFREATKEAYSYLFCDCTQACPEKYRLRSNILFDKNQPMTIYERTN